MEAEIDQVLASGAQPVAWLDLMPHVRAAFEEAMRLYPPAPSINRRLDCRRRMDKPWR